LLDSLDNTQNNLVIDENGTEVYSNINVKLQSKGNANVDVNTNTVTFQGGDALAWLEETLPFNFEIKLRVLNVKNPENLVF